MGGNSQSTQRTIDTQDEPAPPAATNPIFPPNQVLIINPPDIDEFLKEITPEVTTEEPLNFFGLPYEEVIPTGSEIIMGLLWWDCGRDWEEDPPEIIWEDASSEWEEEREEILAKIAEPSSPPPQGAIVPNLAERLAQRKPQHRWLGLRVENIYCDSCGKTGCMHFRPLQWVGTNPNEIFRRECFECGERMEVNRWGVVPKTKDAQCQATEEDFKNLNYLSRWVRNSARYE